MEKGVFFMKTFFHVVNETEQRKVICNHLRLIPLDEVQTVFRLSPSLFSQPCRFRRAVKSASFPPGEAKEGLYEFASDFSNGILRTANPSGAVRHLPFQGRFGGPWLPGGEAGSPQGLTCAPAGAMQASNRR